MSVDFIRVDHHDQAWLQFLPMVHAAMCDVTASMPTATPWLHIGWFRGPHILVGINSLSGLTDEQRNRIARVLRRVVQDCPSLHDVDEIEWVRVSAALAREDLIEGPFVPLALDNRAVWIDRPEARVYLDDRVAETMGLLVAAGTDTMIRTLVAGPEALSVWAFTGMVELAAAYRGGGLGRGYLSYLSHWKEFILWQPAGEKIESIWSKAYDQQRGQLRDIVRAVSDRCDATLPDADWHAWVENSLDVATVLAEHGEIAVNRPESWLDRATYVGSGSFGRWEFGDNRGYSDFHQQFRKLDTTQFGLAVEFASYRFVESVQFRLFLLAGLEPAQRSALAYFLFRAVEDELNIRWQDIVALGIERQTVGTSPQREAGTP